MTIVIDSSALLALIKDEPGAEVVSEVIWSAVTSPVIFVESVSKAANQGYDAQRVAARLLAEGLSIHTPTTAGLLSAIGLHALAFRNVSLADRFCLALALELGVPLLTADRPWRDLGLPIELRLIR